MTEQEMRKADVPTPKSTKDLSNYIEGLVDRPHDYGTCVYAMSMSAVAAFNYVASKLGVTGFQASCADMDVLTRTRNLKGPWKIVDASKMLYPQYDLLADTRTFLAESRAWASEEAKKLLADPANNRAHPDVRAHWRELANDPSR